MNVLDAGSAFENIARVMRTRPTILRFSTSSAFRVLPLRLCVIGCLATAPACQRDAAPEPSPQRSATEQPASQHSASTLGSAKNPGSTIESAAQKNAAQKNAAATGTAPTVRATAGDPMKGKFTLEDATKGLPGTGPLQANIDTDLGTLKCDLFEDKAPITVANFVGLARGTRPWKQDGKWVTKPLYDGTVFHRVVRGFMIQGGDPNGNGTGGPGYEIPDEIWPGAKHDERGLLCMANRGKDTNGSQFFIMDGKASHLDGGYTIFGKCGPDAVIEKLSSVKVQGQTAVNPTQIKTVTITRKQ